MLPLGVFFLLIRGNGGQRFNVFLKNILDIILKAYFNEKEL